MLTRLAPSRLAAAVFLAVPILLLGACAELTRPVALVFDQPEKSWRLETVSIGLNDPKVMPDSFPVFTADAKGKRLLGYPAVLGPPHGLPTEVRWSQSKGWVIQLEAFTFRSPSQTGDPEPHLSPDGLYAVTVERIGPRVYRVEVAESLEITPVD